MDCPRIAEHDAESRQRDQSPRRDDALAQLRDVEHHEHRRRAGRRRGKTEQPDVCQHHARARRNARARAEPEPQEHDVQPRREEADVQSRDREKMRESRASVALAQFGIELRATRDDERVYQRCARAEQPPAALRDPIAQRAPPARDGVELAHTPRDEDAAAAVTEKASRDDPGRAAMRQMAVRPPDGERAAARTALDARFDDPARGGCGIRESDNRCARMLAHTGRALFAQRRRAPQRAGHKHDSAGCAERRVTEEQRGAEQHAPRRHTHFHAA